MSAEETVIILTVTVTKEKKDEIYTRLKQAISPLKTAKDIVSAQIQTQTYGVSEYV